MRNLTFSLIGSDNFKKLHNSSLEILENLGVKIYHKELYSKVINCGRVTR